MFLLKHPILVGVVCQVLHQFADKPGSSLPGGQICNYVYDNESGEDFGIGICNNISVKMG